MSYQGKHVWIIGASSGIGYALAKELSSRGAILSLSARDMSKLENLRHEIGLQHHVFSLDVTNRISFETIAQLISGNSMIDSIIYLAAEYQPMALMEMGADMVSSIISTNINGPFNLVQAIAKDVKAGNVKQIALCGSVAGYSGLPNGQPYSATKAAVINLAESLRAELSPEIDVKLINPGFVRTNLTNKNKFTMPMMIEPKQAAKEIANGLLQSGFEIHFPKRFTRIMKLISHLPYWIYFRVLKKLK